MAHVAACQSRMIGHEGTLGCLSEYSAGQFAHVPAYENWVFAHEGIRIPRSCVQQCKCVLSWTRLVAHPCRRCWTLSGFDVFVRFLHAQRTAKLFHKRVLVDPELASRCNPLQFHGTRGIAVVVLYSHL